MITLSLTEAVRLAFLNGGEFTGGAPGIPIIPLPGKLSLFGMRLIPAFDTVDTHLALYFLSAGLLIFSLAVVWRNRIEPPRLGNSVPCSRTRSSLPASESTSPTIGYLRTRFAASSGASGAPTLRWPSRASTPRCSVCPTPSSSSSIASWVGSRTLRVPVRRHLPALHRLRGAASAAGIPAAHLRHLHGGGDAVAAQWSAQHPASSGAQGVLAQPRGGGSELSPLTGSRTAAGAFPSPSFITGIGQAER